MAIKLVRGAASTACLLPHTLSPGGWIGGGQLNALLRGHRKSEASDGQDRKASWEKTKMEPGFICEDSCPKVQMGPLLLEQQQCVSLQKGPLPSAITRSQGHTPPCAPGNGGGSLRGTQKD